MKSSSLVATLLACVLVSGVAANINAEFASAANNMIGGDVDTGSLLAGITTNAGFDAKDDYSGNVDALADTCIEIKIPLFTTFTFKIYPYRRIRPLKFGSNTKIQSLTFTNSVSSTSASVTANGLYAMRNGNHIQLRQASGTASSNVNKQYATQTVRKCRTILFWTDCWNENVQVERGLQHWELERITTKLQRSAAIAMRDRIKSSTGLASLLPMSSLGSLYLDESNKLRQLYTQLEYDYSELNNVPLNDLVNAISTAALSQITDSWIRARIQQVATSTYRSCFLVAPTANYFFVFGVTNFSGTFMVKMSTFKVEGRLPVGAFLTSVGTWNFERFGEGASPSLHQIVSIFPALKG